MTEGIWIALIGGVVTIGAGLIGSAAYVLKRMSEKETARIEAENARVAGLSNLVDQLQEQQAALTRRVDQLESRNSRLWSYNRSLVDHIYQQKPPPPPAPPEGLH